MSKSNTLENELLLHIFQNANIALIGDATGLRSSTTVGSLYVSLHTADPGEAGSQTTNEAAYTGYARKAVARTSGAWTVTNNLVENAAVVTFDPCTAGSSTVTYFGVGTDSAGAGKLLYSGALTGSLAISAGIIPEFAAGDLDITED
jgi:hypothetical protein